MMNHAFRWVALALATSFALVTSAGAQPPGVNLSWDDCNASIAGGLNKTSNCQSNSEAAKNVYGSYVLPQDVPILAGNEIIIDICTNSGSLPCWWNFTTAPRTTGYDVQFSSPCANAYDYWGAIPGGLAVGSFAQLLPSNLVPRIRIRAIAAVDVQEAQPVAASVGEIFSFRLQLKHGATVGTCTGCTTPAFILLSLIRVSQTGGPSIDLTTSSSRNFVFWQGSGAQAGCLPDPIINKTWGSVKALYR
jgi:hypothetical protein